MGFNPVRAVAIATLSLLIFHAPPAFAEAVTKYCDIDTEDGCVVGLIKNRSSATVVSIDVTQKGKHGCEKDERHINLNLNGGWNEGKRIRIHVSDSCRYEIKFNATHGCTGHKLGTYSRKNLENRRRQMNLLGACGSLDTQTVRPPFYNRDVGQPDS